VEFLGRILRGIWSVRAHRITFEPWNVIRIGDSNVQGRRVISIQNRGLSRGGARPERLVVNALILRDRLNRLRALASLRNAAGGSQKLSSLFFLPHRYSFLRGWVLCTRERNAKSLFERMRRRVARLCSNRSVPTQCWAFLFTICSFGEIRSKHADSEKRRVQMAYNALRYTFRSQQSLVAGIIDIKSINLNYI